MTTGEEIRLARTAAGLTQQQMTKLMQIPLISISNWETGRREPPPYVKRFILNELAVIAKKVNKNKK